MLMAFWEKWYFPANAVLYIVGDLGSEVSRIEALIEGAFGAVPPGRERLPGSSEGSISQNGNGVAHVGNGISKEPIALGPLKRKHEVSLAVFCLCSSFGWVCSAMLSSKACDKSTELPPTDNEVDAAHPHRHPPCTPSEDLPYLLSFQVLVLCRYVRVLSP